MDRESLRPNGRHHQRWLRIAEPRSCGTSSSRQTSSCWLTNQTWWWLQQRAVVTNVASQLTATSGRKMLRRSRSTKG
ncbi:hypothetical protein LDENG_00220050 [Lucifuga dentata]|nr:hypothetical protein LDENG_00220050 [Lucifuga dentata]